MLTSLSSQIMFIIDSALVFYYAAGTVRSTTIRYIEHTVHRHTSNQKDQKCRGTRLQFE